MTRTIPAVCVGLAMAGLSVAAAQNPTTQSGSSSQARGTSVTLTGCVKPWDASMSMPGGSSSTTPGSTSPSRSAGMGNMYALTDIERSGSMGSTSGSTSSTPSPGGSSATMGSMQSTYLLHSNDSSMNLSQHVNHKVAITGTLSDVANMPMAGSPSTGTSGATGTTGSTGAGTPGVGGSTGTTGSTGTAGAGRTSGATGTPGAMTSQSSPHSASMPQTLTISSVRMISATCASGQ
ncbi:MAG: hypothetical protein U0Q11_26065 [Vicinamibacterales bacterium]